MDHTERSRLVDLAAKNRLPAVYASREFVDAGGLMAYGPDGADLFRRAATYADKILNGAKPGDLPVESKWIPLHQWVNTEEDEASSGRQP